MVQSGMPSLCVFDKPYILGRCEPKCRIVNDKTKLLNIGSVDQHDNTAKTEQKL